MSRRQTLAFVKRGVDKLQDGTTFNAFMDECMAAWARNDVDWLGRHLTLVGAMQTLLSLLEAALTDPDHAYRLRRAFTPEDEAPPPPRLRVLL